MLCRIGAGAYGEVWLARNTATQAERAVKIVFRATFADERPFIREFEGIKRFDAVSRSHPTQLTLFHVGKGDGFFYYVMELADPVTGSAGYRARTLRSDLENGRLPAATVLELGLTLAEALHHLHKAGLVHRDVKPSNIIFVRGKPKLADIGLVTDASDSYSIVGTEGYLAPEGPGTPQADIFALGKVLYEALTGQDRRQFPELPPDLSTWPDRRAAIELNEIILKACAKNTAVRYSSADAMLADVKLLQAGKSVQKRRVLQRAATTFWKAAAVLAIFTVGSPLLINERQRREALAIQNRPEWIKAGTTNPAAWQAWRRAFQMVSSYTTSGLSNGIAEWEHATRLDSNYVSAWSTLSVTLVIAVNEGHLPGTNTLPRAKACAQKATSLDPGAGAPYVALAACNLSMDYDFEAAETLFRKAIELDPNNQYTRLNFAWELLFQGRFEEAEELWKHLNHDEPERANSYIGLAIIAFNRGEQSEALTLFGEGIRLAPDRPLWQMWHGDCLWAANQKTNATLSWLRQIELGGFYFMNREEDSSTLRNLLKQQGPDAFLSAFLAFLESHRRSGQFVSAFDLARLYAHAGNKSQALDNLELAMRELRGMNRSLLVNPAFTSLKAEPRFHVALRHLKLEK